MFIKIFILFFCFTDLLLCEETTTSVNSNVENTDTTILVDTEIPEITENTTDKDTENVTKSNTNPESTKETTVLPIILQSLDSFQNKEKVGIQCVH